MPDINSQDEMELIDRRLCEAARALQEFEESRQNMLALINHDLRTPLSAIILTLDLFSNLPENENNQPLLIVKAETNSLYSRLTDFLLLEKLEHGSYDKKDEKVVIDEVLDGLCNLLCERLNLSENKFAVINDNPDADWVMDGDKDLIGKLFEQLLLNSCQHGNKEEAVQIIWNMTPEKIEIEILDSCNGFSSELESHIFERFRTVNNQPLAGFGLTLARRIAQLHKGDLQCAKNSPEGCSFKISLPKANAF